MITGLGAVSCLGLGAGAQFQKAASCSSGITKFSTSLAIPVDIVCAGSITTPLPPLLDASTSSMFDRVAHLSWFAAHEAITQARTSDLTTEEAHRSAVFWGTGFGGSSSIEQAYADLFLDGKNRLRPFTVIGVMGNGSAALISLKSGFKGPSLNYSTACASSAHAIGEAYRNIKHGYCERAIAGGAESLLNAAPIKAWEALRTLASPDPLDISRSCKPFSKNRSGFVLGEAAACLMLESLESAMKRGAPILAEIIGYGASSDSVHITKPDVDGQTRAILAALTEANLNPSKVAYINAHGTATEVGDIAETQSIKNAFGDHLARNLCISSTKAIHGHTLGAAGALELVITVQAMQQGVAPGTAFLDEPDPLCDLDYLPQQSLEMAIPYAMSNSFAFGGSNASIVLARDVR